MKDRRWVEFRSLASGMVKQGWIVSQDRSSVGGMFRTLLTVRVDEDVPDWTRLVWLDECKIIKQPKSRKAA